MLLFIRWISYETWHQNEKLFIFSFSMILENQGCYFRWRPMLGFPKLQVLFANPSEKFVAVSSFPVVVSQRRHNRNTVLFSSSRSAWVARTFARPISGIGEERRRRHFKKAEESGKKHTFSKRTMAGWRILENPAILKLPGLETLSLHNGCYKVCFTYKPGMWQGDHMWFSDTRVP